MRLDKFLKKSGIIKRRTLAQEMIRKGLVLINGKEGRPSHLVKEGDEIRVILPYQVKSFKIKSLKEGQAIEIIELKGE